MAYKINIRTDNGSWLNILQDKYIEHDYSVTGIGTSATSNIQLALKYLYDGYTHVQSTPSLTWVVVHNLGKQYVDVTVIDSNDEKMYPSTIKYDSLNQLTITFSIAETGNAIITI